MTLQAYIGCKIIAAEPQDKDGQSGYKVVYPDNYLSWSPKSVFEEAYRPVSQGERNIVESVNLCHCIGDNPDQ